MISITTKNRFLFLIFIICFSFTVLNLTVLTVDANAQITEVEPQLKENEIAKLPDGWRFGGFGGITVSQTYLNNWIAGGESSYSINGLLSVFAKLKDKNNIWDNTLDIGYGILNQENVDFVKKTDDKLEITSKYGKKAFSDFYYSIFASFKTQFSPGYNYENNQKSNKISDFFAPAYLIGALGLDYKPNDYLSIFFAPATERLTIVNDENLSQIGAFGVEPGEKIKTEFGGYLRLVFSKNDFTVAILQNVSITSQLNLFSDYLGKPQNISVGWENLLALKVNKYLSVNISTNLVYDHNVIIDGVNSKLQFKEILGIGFLYNF